GALAWIGAVTLWNGRRGADPLLSVLLALGLALGLIVVVTASAGVFLAPRNLVLPALVAGPWGWASALLAAAAVVAWSRSSGRPVAPDALGLGTVCVASFLALGLAFR